MIGITMLYAVLRRLCTFNAAWSRLVGVGLLLTCAWLASPAAIAQGGAAAAPPAPGAAQAPPADAPAADAPPGAPADAAATPSISDTPGAEATAPADTRGLD